MLHVMWCALEDGLILVEEGKMRATIGMQNDRPAVGRLPHGHLHPLDDELTGPPRTHRPADHKAGIQSSTMERYNQHSAIRMSVRSVTHVVSEAVTVKSPMNGSASPPEEDRKSSPGAVGEGRPGIRPDASSGRPAGSYNSPRHSAVPPTSADCRARHGARLHLVHAAH